MAHYFIDVRDSHGVTRDKEGADFRNIEDALEEAKASARDLIKQHVDDQVPLNEMCIVVRDDRGSTVATLKIAEILDHPIHPEFKND